MSKFEIEDARKMNYAQLEKACEEFNKNGLSAEDIQKAWGKQFSDGFNAGLKVKMTEASWISLKDRLPERLQCVLGHMQGGFIYVVCQCSLDELCNDWHFMPHTQELLCVPFEVLTHWMPLPDEPIFKDGE